MDGSTLKDYPWPHWVIDNFLDKEDFNIIKKEALDILDTIDVTNSPSPIEKNHGIYIVRRGEDKQWPKIAKKYELIFACFTFLITSFSIPTSLIFKINVPCLYSDK